MPVQLLQEYALTLEWGLKKQSHKLRMVSDTIYYSQGRFLSTQEIKAYLFLLPCV